MNVVGVVIHTSAKKVLLNATIAATLAVSCSSTAEPAGVISPTTTTIAALPSPTTPERTPDLTLRPGVLSVCTNDGTQPFSYKDEDNQWIGFDVELLEEIADRNDLSLELNNYEFAGIWTRPERDECDLSSSALTITEERQEVALFSNPYFDANQSLAIRDEDIGEITSLDDLRGRSIGVLEGSTGQAFARSTTREAAIKALPNVAAVYEAIENDEVDAVLIGQPTNTSKEKTLPIETVAIFFTSEQYGMATALDNTQLMDLINQTLDELRSDGTYKQIQEKWL